MALGFTISRRKQLYFFAIAWTLIHAQAHATRLSRVVSTSPQTTQLLCEMGLENVLVGAPRGWTPPGIPAWRSIGDLLTLNFEVILRTKPELIVVDDQVDFGELERYSESFGIQTSRLEFGGPRVLLRSLSGIIKKVSGDAAFGERVTVKLNCLKELADRVAFTPFTFVIIVVSDPLIVFGPRTFLSSILESFGGRNLAPSTGLFPQLSPEYLVRYRPDRAFSLEPGLEGRFGEVTYLEPDVFSRVSFQMIQRLPGVGIPVPEVCRD